MPYPFHKDQHQRLNAAELVKAGAGVICDDTKSPAANAENLRKVMISLMNEPVKLDEMKKSAAGMGKPNAAQTVAKWLVQNCR